MNWLDVVILVPVCWFGFKGFKNGLIQELASIAALVLGIWATVRFSDLVASWLGDSQMVRIMAFILTFLVVLVLVFMAGKIVERIVKIVIPAFINHLFGLAFGVVKILLIFSVLFYCIRVVDSKEIIVKKTTKEGSFLYGHVAPLFPRCKQWIYG